MSEQGNLYLIPVPISGSGLNTGLPEFNLEIVRQLKKFITENSKEARKFLKQMGYGNLQEAQMLELNVHNREGDKTEFLNFIKGKESVGLMSDAGCPCIADPGAEIVSLAHKKGIRVVPLVGPSSIVLSIMASGFNGQNFAFVGYLPIDKSARQKRLRELEQLSAKSAQAQFFIETPYRNQSLYEHLLNVLSPATKLFIGRDAMGERELFLSKTVEEWKKTKLTEFQKIPCVFGIYGQ